MSDFLKKMQQALVTGKKDEELTEYMKTIEEKAEKVIEPNKAIENRLKEAGEKILSDKEREELSSVEKVAHNKEIMDEIKQEDEKWAMLAIIENMKSELNKLKVDFEKLKEKYEDNISKITENIEKSENKFEETYGVVETTKTPYEKLVENFEVNKKEKKEEGGLASNSDFYWRCQD